MEENHDLDLVVQNFVSDFNSMCRRTGRAYLLRPVASKKSEDSGKTTRYNVSYKMKTTEDGWEVYAEWRFLFIFSKQFPLLKIKKNGRYGITFEGLYVTASPNIEQKAAALATALNNYLNYCANQPEDSFVRV